MRYSIIGATVQQVRTVGGTDIKEARSTGIIFATLTDAQAARLKAMGCQVDKVGEVKATIMPPTPFAGIPTYTPELIIQVAGFEEVRRIFTPPIYGEGFTLAIIDSGIRESHEKISGRVVYRKNYTSDPMRDGLDHGTGVCSIALAVAPLCNILNLKVLNDKGEGTEEDVTLAIDDCISLHDTNPDIAPSVINLSLGGPDNGNPYSPMRVACRAAIDRAIWVVASCGNGGPAPYTITSPACERYVFAVGSAKYEPFQVSEFSSRGPNKEGFIKPDMLMVGEDLSMASSSSDTATVAKSGTSFATPFISAASLLYHEAVYRWVSYSVGALPGVLPKEEATEVFPIEAMMDERLPAICIKPQGVIAGKDNDYGYGLPLGSLITKVLAPAVAVDITAILAPIMAIGMMGMIMVPMVKALR